MPFDSDTARKAGKKSSRKGIPNKDNAPLRAVIAEFLDGNFQQFRERMERLPDDKYVDAFLKLLEYRLPKLQRSDMTIDISSMSDAEIERLFDMALQKLESDDD